MEEQLIRTLLHNLNNSLFIISGKTELLLDGDISSEVKKDLKEIAGQADKMRLLIQEAAQSIKGDSHA